jgi:hypothetical protein
VSDGWFKTAKHRFGLHRFGQGTLWGVYRWLVLSLLAYLLAHWAYLSVGGNTSPDWSESAQLALETLLPQVVLLLLLFEIQRLQPLARSALRSVRLSAHAEVSASLSHGFNIQVTRCKI